jgi:peptide methionine sulfoxide reductase MsrB
MSSEKVKEITKEQAEEILNAGISGEMRYGDVPVRCNYCSVFSPIKNMKIEKYSLNDLHDVIVEGKCGNCGGRIARYFETGENEESRKIAIKIWRDNDSDTNR